MKLYSNATEPFLSLSLSLSLSVSLSPPLSGMWGSQAPVWRRFLTSSEWQLITLTNKMEKWFLKLAIRC